MNTLMGRMMGMPLLVSSLLTHAARHAGDTEVVSRLDDRAGEGDLHRTTWAGLEPAPAPRADRVDRQPRRRRCCASTRASCRWSSRCGRR